MNTVTQQGCQRQNQSEQLYWRQLDMAQRAAVKMINALNSFNIKLSGFN